MEPDAPPQLQVDVPGSDEVASGVLRVVEDRLGRFVVAKQNCEIEKY